LRSIDSLGNMAPFFITGILGAPEDSWTGDWYFVGPAPAAVPFTVNRFSSWIQPSGNPSKANSPRLPVIENFEPADPAPPLQLAVGFQSRYGGTSNLKGVSLFQLTTGLPRVAKDALFAKFQELISKPIPAVAFMGHALVEAPPGYIKRGIGLCFYDGCYERETVSGDPELNCTGIGCFLGYTGANYPLVPPLASQATIIFISACDVDANMQAWLGVSNNTPGRALVVPVNQTAVDIDMGEYEWLQILRFLTSGENLQQAVSDANAAVKAKPWGQIQPDGSTLPTPAQAWRVIGDGGNGGTGIQF
jgi:hypothetical protein